MFKVRRERFKGDRRDTLITEGGGNVEQFARGSGRGRYNHNVKRAFEQIIHG